MEKIGAYEAKTHLPRLLEKVARGEVITITKHGCPWRCSFPTLSRNGLSQPRPSRRCANSDNTSSWTVFPSAS